MSVLSLCMFPGFILCFWAKTWVKTRPKIVPSIFCYFCRSHRSRVCVSHTCTSFSDFSCHAFASFTRSCHSCRLYSTRLRQARIRVAAISSFRAFAWALRLRHCSLVISLVFCVPSIFASFLSNLQLIHAL